MILGSLDGFAVCEPDTLDQLTEALGALDVALSAEDLAAIEAAVPRDAAAGGRYAEAMLAHMDSEK